MPPPHILSTLPGNCPLQGGPAHTLSLPQPQGVNRTWPLPWKTQLPAPRVHPIIDALTWKQVKHLVGVIKWKLGFVEHLLCPAFTDFYLTTTLEVCLDLILQMGKWRLREGS